MKNIRSIGRIAALLLLFAATVATAQVRPDQFAKENSLRDKNLGSYSQEGGVLRGFKVDSVMAQSFGIYQPIVTYVAPAGNPVVMRSKIVTDYKGRVFAVDFYGNSKILIDTAAYATTAQLNALPTGKSVQAGAGVEIDSSTGKYIVGVPTLNALTTAVFTKASTIQLRDSMAKIRAKIVADSLLWEYKTNYVLSQIDSIYNLLAIGQSNMVGHGAKANYEINYNVSVLNNLTGVFEIATNLNTHDIQDGYVTNNSAAWAAAKIIAEKTGKHVRLIIVAKGGQPISQWTPNGIQYAKIQTAIQKVQGNIHGILLIQGEADASGGDNNTNWDYYVNAVKSFKANLIASSSKFKINTPFIIGGINPNTYNFFSNIHKTIAASDPNIGYADGNGLSDIGDGVHYSGTALDSLGARMASAFFDLPRKSGSEMLQVDGSNINSTKATEGLFVFSNTNRSITEGVALTMGGKVFGDNSPMGGYFRIFATAGDTNRYAGFSNAGRVTLGTKRGYSKNNTSNYFYGDDISISKNGYVGINVIGDAKALLHIRGWSSTNQGQYPLIIDSLPTAPLGTNSMLAIASDANGSYVYKVGSTNGSTINNLSADSYGNISTSNLSSGPSGGFRVNGNYSQANAVGSGLELSYASGTSYMYSFNRSTSNGNLNLSVGGFGNKTVIGGLTPNSSYDLTIDATKTIFQKEVYLTLPTYVTEQDAIMGGLSQNRVYKTPTGEIRIKL